MVKVWRSMKTNTFNSFKEYQPVSVYEESLSREMFPMTRTLFEELSSGSFEISYIIKIYIYILLYFLQICAGRPFK